MCVEAKVCVWEAGLKKGVGAGDIRFGAQNSVLNSVLRFGKGRFVSATSFSRVKTGMTSSRCITLYPCLAKP